MSLRGAILAGGGATRYGGRPKGLLEVGGRRILDRVVTALSAAVGAPPLLVANAPDAATWRPDLTTVPDVRPGYGSLGGIYTAVTAGAGPVLCVAWDMPFVTVDLLRELVDGAAGVDVFLPESDSRRGMEPLCGVYGPACRAAIEGQFGSEDRRLIGFHNAVKVGTLPLDRVQTFGDPAELFLNVNEPGDLQRAEAVWRRRG